MSITSSLCMMCWTPLCHQSHYSVAILHAFGRIHVLQLAFVGSSSLLYGGQPPFLAYLTLSTNFFSHLTTIPGNQIMKLLLQNIWALITNIKEPRHTKAWPGDITEINYLNRVVKWSITSYHVMNRFLGYYFCTLCNILAALINVCVQSITIQWNGWLIQCTS